MGAPQSRALSPGILAPGRAEPAIDFSLTGRAKRTIVGTWDSYYGELRVPLPWLLYGAELMLDYDDYSVSGEERLTGAVSMDDVPGALPASIPRWLLPREPYLRVPEALWSEYTILSSSATARQRGPRR
jgi:hypothetical protein